MSAMRPHLPFLMKRHLKRRTPECGDRQLTLAILIQPASLRMHLSNRRRKASFANR
jgi:hypothetical protein